jgi:hypothetical protein
MRGRAFRSRWPEKGREELCIARDKLRMGHEERNFAREELLMGHEELCIARDK